MGLAEYRRKRSFARTPEPAGKVARRRGAKAALFVVQKHAAQRLHYDFRLESDGVLKSWAVPKGPSLDPKERRLAVEVEDHPLEYGSFEGTIPEGEYGGGSVLLWDRGSWQPDGSAAEGLRRGRLKFRLDGEKLSGGWTLVRMAGSEESGKPNWLLIKENDEAARRGDITKERPESVASGRDIEEIGTRPERVWRSGRKRAAADTGAPRRPQSSRGHSPAKRAAMPAFVAPQLATLVDETPAGADWVHEIKLDGYRILSGVANGRARLWTRSGLDWSERFPRLAEDLGRLETASALLDGEVVALDAAGRSSFQALQRALGDDDGDLVYFVFDLLALDGKSLRQRPLGERKAALAALLERSPLERVRLSDHVAAQGDEFFRHACELGVEGVVSKRAEAPYRSGRNRDWLKTKCAARQEFVIGAYTDPQGSRTELGALLVGIHEGGELRYAGKVGTGFDSATLAELKRKLAPLEQQDSPFANPPRGAVARGVHWVKPRLVAEVSFTEWTADGRLRHPAFRGLREDKSAREVRRESPATPPPPGKQPPKRGPTGRKPKVQPTSETAVAGITLSNPGRVYFPERELTKLDLARYYESVAARMLPHITGRPLTLVRCPQGRGKHCFYQKHLREDTPPAVRSVEIREGSGDAEPYPYVEDVAGLVALVQLGVLEFHAWGARADDVERPDRLVFDLDPDEGLAWRAVADAAVELRQRLGEAGLDSWLQTTGGKGLHVVAPITRRYGWDEVKPFCRGIAEAMVADSPARYVSKASKAARRGKIFIDWLRNGRGATAIMPYSSRARANATVAMPISWRDVARVDPASFTIESVPGRLARGTDPWRDFHAHRQQLTRAALRKVVS